MKIKYYGTAWGMKHLPLANVLQKLKASGYEGAEIALDPDLVDVKAAKQLFTDNGMGFLAQLPYPKDDKPAAMLPVYLSKLERLLQLEPVMVNSHTGRDHFTFEQNLEFIVEADVLAKKYGIMVCHETHRGRFSYAAVVMEKYIEAFPDLKLTADLSHWCVVAESLLENQQNIIDKVAPHCHYIHARVGYAQGAQVPDPASPAYEKELLQHTKWWQQIVDHHKQNETAELIITPEFGPPPYMLPAADAPDRQYNMNLFMKDHLIKTLKV
jgi:hypothetical protein